MKKFALTLSMMLISAAVATAVPAAEVDTPDPDAYRRPRGYAPPPRYYDPPPRYIPSPPPRQRLGDLCVVEDSRSGRTCDLRRPQPVNTYCECVSPSGRVRDGRVR